jgi:hypothetical protein
MSLALVPRGVRALADQLNAYYRVFKGNDPDSVYLRLNNGGSVEVRHSATNAAVFKVTDAGVTGSYQPGDITNPDLADGSVTSAKIQDGTIVDADVAAAGTANINGAKLAPVSVTTAQLADQAVTSVKIADLTIANGDIAPGAAIAPSKLAALSTDQILKDVGSGVVGGGLLVNANVAAAGTANIALAKLQAVSANQIVKDVGSGVVGGGLLVDANVAAAGTANIAINKLADVGAGNVLRSNGAGNVAGKVVSGDILDGTIVNADIAAAGTANIDGAKLAVNSVPSDRIMGGATIPANSIDSSHIIDGSVDTLDLHANAATLVVRATPSSSSPGTSNGTFILMPEMTVSIATVGGPITIAFYSDCYGAVAGNTANFDIYVDGSSVTKGLIYNIQAVNAHFGVALLHNMPIASGNHTVEVRWFNGGGGGIYAYSTYRTLTVTEFRR